MNPSVHTEESGKPGASCASAASAASAASVASATVPGPLSNRILADLRLYAMANADLPEVEAIERDVYEHPWTMGNFIDSLASGYETGVARDGAGAVAGYFLLLIAPDEAHLLNITVRRAFQGHGIGRVLLDRACQIARARATSAMLLEVRPSNPHALAVYRHVGFRQIGVRKGYYPAAHQKREDAIVMRLGL